MEATLRSKRFYALAIGYIALFAIVFKWIYPEVAVTALTTVVALCGCAAALGTNWLITRMKRKRGKDDGK